MSEKLKRNPSLIRRFNEPIAKQKHQNKIIKGIFLLTAIKSKNNETIIVRKTKLFSDVTKILHTLKLFCY